MTTHRCDVAIIGAGTAGMGAYRAATAHGAKTLLIEGGVYGTTCARVGCMPSKLLIAAANAAHGAREAEGFGVQVPEVRVDGPAVMRRVQAERDRFVGFVVATVEGWPQAHRLHASARFEAPGVLALSNGDRVEASRVVIATGSTPQLPGALAVLPRERVDTNDSIFEWLDLPESVAVFGTGVIGLELGQALHRLGVRVRIFGRSQRIAGISDPEVATKNEGGAGAAALGGLVGLRTPPLRRTDLPDGKALQNRQRMSNLRKLCRGFVQPDSDQEHVLHRVRRWAARR